MAEPVDYYDVQAMIRDARSEVRGEISDAVREACRQLRAEHDEAIGELGEKVSSLQRVLDARTESAV